MSSKKTYLIYMALVMLFSFLSVLMLTYPLPYSELNQTAGKVFKPKRKKDHEETGARQGLNYPKRVSMEKCRKAYGRVTILVMYTAETLPTGTNGRTLACYASLSDYELIQVDIDINEEINAACSKHKVVRFKKYCAAAYFLKDTDWMLVVDDNAAVANPNHCVEEWIDERVNLNFVENFNNWEISDENYLVRRSSWSMKILQELAGMEFNQALNQNKYDKGILLAFLAHTLVDDGDMEYEQCMTEWGAKLNHHASTACGRLVLGYQRLWPGKVRIYRKGHGWIRDSALTSNFWCESDFILQNWQEQSIQGELWMSPHDNKGSDICALKGSTWEWLPNKRLNCTVIREDLQAFETMRRKNYPKIADEFMRELDVWSCYPRCELH
uniref:Hexosyltransferase n=1 Tax=Haemonchus contortus TaxID=6289 RepID=A0A7I4YA38_HAECO